MMDTGRTTRPPTAPKKPASFDLGTLMLIVMLILAVGLIWGGVSWVWNRVSGNEAAGQAQLEQTWNETAPMTKQTWCTWAITGNLTGAGSALVALGYNKHGYTLEDMAARDLILHRCGLSR